MNLCAGILIKNLEPLCLLLQMLLENGKSDNSFYVHIKEMFNKSAYWINYGCPMLASVADPGCLSQIPDPDIYPPQISDLGRAL